MRLGFHFNKPIDTILELNLQQLNGIRGDH